jgi:hypothetical protein
VHIDNLKSPLGGRVERTAVLTLAVGAFARSCGFVAEPFGVRAPVGKGEQQMEQLVLLPRPILRGPLEVIVGTVHLVVSRVDDRELALHARHTRQTLVLEQANYEYPSPAEVLEPAPLGRSALAHADDSAAQLAAAHPVRPPGGAYRHGGRGEAMSLAPTLPLDRPAQELTALGLEHEARASQSWSRRRRGSASIRVPF